jgi:Zn-finger nucleic acid-binding protein
MPSSCPDCAAPLTVVTSAGSRILVCSSCRGRMMGLSPFEHLLADGAGAQVWVGSEEGGPAGPCPYCHAALRHPDGDPEAAVGLAVCRTCQQVWVPASAAEWMTAHAASSGRPGADAASVVAAPAQCSNCGAPYQPDEDGRCHWCQAQIAAPQPIVMFMEQPVPDHGIRLF